MSGEGVFPRLNATMLENGMGEGMILSICGAFESTDGQSFTLRTSDGKTLQYAISGDIEFEQGKIVEVMGAKNADNGVQLDAFVARDLGQDFDLDLYNDLITKVISSGRYNDIFIPK
mmetsp:Transcript_18854/g.21842  ORF Transcript_18854/g.21842 Transcript_18854/m.21842 type:complete len:117 (-) Transcript_18854:288-638(-)